MRFRLIDIVFFSLHNNNIANSTENSAQYQFLHGGQPPDDVPPCCAARWCCHYLVGDGALGMNQFKGTGERKCGVYG